MFEYINLVLMIVGYFLLSFFYTLSLRIKHLEEKIGKAAWKKTSHYRMIGSIFETTVVINEILWIWYPVKDLNWKIFSDSTTAIIVGLVLLILFGVVLFKGMIDAGMETMYPSEDTEMYGGIYNYIRHPQTLGEFPMFAWIGIMINSWCLTIIGLLYCIIYIPIMIHYEEEDLVKRFGDKYREYQKRTGAIFPKLFKKAK